MQERRLLKPIPDRHTDLLFNIVSDGKIEMGIHRVMYGYRIRAGYVGEGWVNWDWCCGDNSFLVSLTYGVARTLLTEGVDFQEVPSHSKVKPWNKDEAFMWALDTKLKEVQPEIKLIELLRTMGLYQPIKIEDYESR